MIETLKNIYILKTTNEILSNKASFSRRSTRVKYKHKEEKERIYSKFIKLLLQNSLRANFQTKKSPQEILFRHFNFQK